MQDKVLDELQLEQPKQEEQESKWREPVSVPFFLPLLWSAVLSCLSVVNPFLTSLATNLQSQNLYTGWAMAQGDVIYGRIYGTSGLFYYLLNWASQLVFGNLLLAVAQFVALFLSGRLLFKIAYQLTHENDSAKQMVHIFYLLTFALGLGGVYASLFAFPLVFAGLYFLLQYVMGEIEDHFFIAFGGLLALLFLVEPLAGFLFATLTFLVLLVYNIWTKKKARGLYQWLAAVLGFSLVFYPLGYITVWNGTFGLAISQISYPFESLAFGQHVWQHGLLYGGLVLGLGFVLSIGHSFMASKQEFEIILQVLSSLAVVGVFLFSVFLPETGAYHLLPALPFAMVLLLLWLGKAGQEKRGRHSGPVEETPSIFSAYFKKSFFLPILALLYLVVYPVANHYAFDSEEIEERGTAAAYIKKEAKKGERIYAWDKTASLYQASGHLAASPLLTPSLYGDTAENKLILAHSITQNHPTYILVHREVPLLDDVKKELKESYQKVDVKMTHFTLYQLK
ncbi:heme transporter CcmD [Streptococcus himalayensis]|uniref:Heme transporter CcmD n=1 Tax=Streptococcus himalayensis TaxID=1888195 RepID=A0A917A2C5_9STRE|nr:heme transporter CcmD [Streptococcus himalayensis]GGE23108.1 heme transporter CcmD [Streptococcus himalayensis]